MKITIAFSVEYKTVKCFITTMHRPCLKPGFEQYGYVMTNEKQLKTIKNIKIKLLTSLTFFNWIMVYLGVILTMVMEKLF